MIDALKLIANALLMIPWLIGAGLVRGSEWVGRKIGLYDGLDESAN